MMQCENCEHEITLNDGNICPHCGMLLNLPVKKKKKKNEELSQLETAAGGYENSRLTPTTAALRIFVMSLALLCVGPSFGGLAFGAWLLLTLLVALNSMDSKHCLRCKHFNTIKRVSHKKIKTQQVIQAFYGNKQQLVEVDTYKDSFRCSHCGYEKTRTYNETGKSSIT